MSEEVGASIRLLGPIELTVDGRSVDLGGTRQRVILSVLALNANRLTSTEHLVDALWGVSPPTTARTQVQICISALRKIFAQWKIPASIETRSAGYALEGPPGLVDTEAFAMGLKLARAATDDARLDDAAATLRDALALWRGQALAGGHNPSLARAAVPLEDRRRAAVEELVELDLRLGRHVDLCPELHGLITEQPLNERL